MSRRALVVAVALVAMALGVLSWHQANGASLAVTYVVDESETAAPPSSERSSVPITPNARAAGAEFQPSLETAVPALESNLVDRESLPLKRTSAAIAVADEPPSRQEMDPVPVTFTVQEIRHASTNSNGLGELSLLVATAGESSQSTSRHTLTSAGVEIRYPPGDYLAVLVDPTISGSGPLSEFSVERVPVSVELARPFSFSLELRLLDLDTREPVRFAHVALDQVGLPTDWQAPALTGSSDAEGFLSVATVSPGRWRIRIEHEGHVSRDETLVLPANELDEASARREGRLNLGDISMVGFTPIQFQLVEAGDWSDLTQFQIAHTHDGERIAFDEEGHALLNIGDYAMPIYLKLWYPDDREAVFYLNNGVPGPEDVQLVTVGGKQTLEVDLQFADDILNQLADKNCAIRVAYRTTVGEEKFVGRDIPASPDSFEFTSIQSSVAMVNFVTWREGELPVDWATRQVQMNPEGVTGTTLVVDSAPRALRFEDEAGHPIPGVTFRMYQAPNDTTWVIGGTSDEAGEVKVPTLSDSLGLVTAQTAGDSHIAMDVPVDLSSANLNPRIVMRDGTETFIEVTCAGDPVQGVWFTFLLATSGVDPIAHRSGADGKTKAFHLHPSSRAELKLDEPSLWAPVRQVPLQPGRNGFQVWRMGEIHVPDQAALSAITSTEFGVSLASWLAEGLVASAELAGGGVSVVVPTGQYRRQIDEENSHQVRVAVNEVLDLR